MIPTSRRAHLFHGEKLWFADGWQDAIEAIGITHGSDWHRLTPGTRVSGGSPITNCYRVELDNGEVIYFKRYVYDKPRPQFWMLPSKAAIEVFGYDFMAKHGMEVPEVVGYGERRHFGVLDCAFIITKEIPDTTTLMQFGRDEWSHMTEPRKSELLGEIAGRLCEQLRCMHAAGFFHQDLKLKNILLRQDKDGLHLVWIDCPRAILAVRKRRAAIIDLGRLGRLGSHYLSVKQQLRWLRDYLGEQATRQEVRRLFYDVKAYLDRRNPPHDYELPGG